MQYDEVEFFQAKGTWRAFDGITGCVYTRATPGEWIANYDAPPGEERWDAMKLSSKEWERLLAEHLKLSEIILESGT